MEATKEALAVLDGMWQGKRYDKDKYIRIVDGDLFYGDDPNSLTPNDDGSFLYDDHFTLTYETSTKTYYLNVIYPHGYEKYGTLKYDGSKIIIYDIDGDNTFLFDDYATRYN